MPTTTELAEVQRSVAHLRRGLDALRRRYGEVPAVQRLVNDLDRFELDLSEVRGSQSVPQQGDHAAQERMAMPDTPYDPSLWDGAEDEGVGGYGSTRR